MLSVEKAPTFRRKLVFTFTVEDFYPEDGRSMFLQIAEIYYNSRPNILEVVS